MLPKSRKIGSTTTKTTRLLTKHTSDTGEKYHVTEINKELPIITSPKGLPERTPKPPDTFLSEVPGTKTQSGRNTCSPATMEVIEPLTPLNTSKRFTTRLLSLKRTGRTPRTTKPITKPEPV